MDRRGFIGTVAGGLLAAPLAAGGQQPDGRLPRVGYLGSGYPSDRSSPQFEHLFAAFVDGLRENGYVDGQTVAIEYRWAEERYERLSAMAEDLVRLGVDVIFAPSDQAAAAAKRASQSLPIVFIATSDPVASRFVATRARPGGNMTGLTAAGVPLTAKRLSLLHEGVAKLSRVAIVRNPKQPYAALHLRVVEDAARELRLRSQVFDARDPRDFARVFSEMVMQRCQAVLVLPDSMLYRGREQLAELALRHRLPMIGTRRELAEAGALLTYGPNIDAEWRRIGVLVGKILKGAKPSDIPVEEPTKFELVINLKTAKILGLTIPQSLLLRADQVIE